MLPRGAGKTTLLAAIAAHHLVAAPNPMVYCGAASVAQARILFEAARDFCAHPDVAPLVVVRSLELRRAEGPGGVLRMVPSDGPRTHGLQGSLYLCDELWAHRDGGLYEAMRSALVKRPDARMATISTAEHRPRAPLSRLRTRALASPMVKRSGGLTTCSGAGLRALLWECADGTDLDDLVAVKRVNPASWITRQALAEQRAALPDGAFARFHMNLSLGREASWLPERGVGGLRRRAQLRPGRADLGRGQRRGRDQPHGGPLDQRRPARRLRDLGRRGGHPARHRQGARARRHLHRAGGGRGHVAVWAGRAGARARRQAHGHLLSADRCTDGAGLPTATRRHRAGPPRAAPDRTLALHAANGVQRHGRRGWRLDKPDRSSPIDGLVALAMALERAEHRPAPVRLLGWI